MATAIRCLESRDATDGWSGRSADPRRRHLARLSSGTTSQQLTPTRIISAHPRYLRAQIAGSPVRTTPDRYAHSSRAPPKHDAREPRTPARAERWDGSDGTRTRDLRRDRPGLRSQHAAPRPYEE